MMQTQNQKTAQLENHARRSMASLKRTLLMLGDRWHPYYMIAVTLERDIVAKQELMVEERRKQK